jgi:hypothetical protein
MSKELSTKISAFSILGIILLFIVLLIDAHVINFF